MDSSVNVYRIEGLTQAGAINFYHVVVRTIEDAIAHGRLNGLEVYEARKVISDVRVIKFI
jgi:hypothetical protein